MVLCHSGLHQTPWWASDLFASSTESWKTRDTIRNPMTINDILNYTFLKIFEQTVSSQHVKMPPEKICLLPQSMELMDQSFRVLRAERKIPNFKVQWHFQLLFALLDLLQQRIPSILCRISQSGSSITACTFINAWWCLVIRTPAKKNLV